MPCLNEHEMSRLLVGSAAVDVADRYETHLLDCAPCLQVAEQVDAVCDDELIAALTGEGEKTPLEDADQSVIDTLIYKLGQLAAEANTAASAKQELDQILSPAQSDDEIGRLAHFRVLEVLGAGGMGIVLKAEDVQLERVVALKVMRPSLASNSEATRRFRREAQSAAAFEHDNIVTIYQVEEDRGVPFFSMQWLEGESLRDRLRREGRLGTAESLRITREIATGLAAAHQRGLLHRDIKPDNVWLCADSNRVKIVDFGLVRSLEEPSSLTHSGVIVGTPQYMAPEQAQGEPVDVRTDLFSTGCVLYHMLCGRPAFEANKVVATLVAVSKAEVTPPRQTEKSIPRPVNDLAMRLLAREPDARVESAEALVDAATELEQRLPQLAEGGQRHKTGRWLWTTVLAACIAAFALGIIFVQTRHGTLVIEADDQVAVHIEGGKVELHDRATGMRFHLRVGENELQPRKYEIIAKEEGSDLEFSSREFTLGRGDERRIKVRLADQPPAIPPGAGGTGDIGPPPRSVSVGNLQSPDASPAWLGDVEQSLGVQPGQPLSPLALVRKPGLRDGVISWTLETAETRGAVNDAEFSPDGTQIATAGQDGTVRILDANAPTNAVHRVPWHRRRARVVARRKDAGDGAAKPHAVDLHLVARRQGETAGQDQSRHRSTRLVAG